MTQLQNARATLDHLLGYIERTHAQGLDFDVVTHHLTYAISCIEDAQAVYERDLEEKENLRRADIAEDYRLDQEYSHQDAEQAAEALASDTAPESEIL